MPTYTLYRKWSFSNECRAWFIDWDGEPLFMGLTVPQVICGIERWNAWRKRHGFSPVIVEF